MATHAFYSLQLIVESFSTGAKQVAPATICNDSFKLIVALASKEAMFAPYVFQDASYLYELNHEGACVQANSLQTSKLIVMYSKTSLHFRKDCGILCEGEREQQWQLNKDNGLMGFIGHGLTGLIGLIGLITGLIRLVGLINCISHIERNSCNSLIG
jgi:hypothetical protein